MKIVVCVKQIQNPEIPSAQFRIDEQAKTLIPVSGLQPVLSPFDEQAVEAALRIRDSAGEAADVEITIVTIAPKASRAPIKAALALGADNAVLLSDSVFDGSGGYVTARNLAETIRTIGEVDLILAKIKSTSPMVRIVSARLRAVTYPPLPSNTESLSKTALSAPRASAALMGAREAFGAIVTIVISTSAASPALSRILKAASTACSSNGLRTGCKPDTGIKVFACSSMRN